MAVQPSPQPTVLVIEDNDDARMALVALLELDGYLVQPAPDGTVGIEVIRAKNPDAVLIDIGLPGMDGYEVAERLRRQAGPSKIVLVALTGYGQEEDRRRSQQAGFDHHLIKPVNLAELQTLIAASAAEP
jgi:two-component system, sensor histidine kinase